MPKPTETVPLTLRFEGPDVEDGSMSLEDIVPVLQGFASAYGKIAAEEGVGVHHRIRIIGVQKGSANILLEVWDALSKAADPLTSLSVLGAGAAAVVSGIVGVIRLKRHVNRQPFSNHITAQNTIAVTNSQNVTIEMPINVYNIYKSKLIDQDISKIVRPLQPGKIEAAEIQAAGPSAAPIRERIEADEKDLFETEEVSVTTTKPTWLVAKLSSLNKNTESGYLYLTDGTRAFYRYVGTSPAILNAIFGTYDGPVRIYAAAHLDESLKVIQVDIEDIQKAQGELFPADLPVDDEFDEDEE